MYEPDLHIDALEVESTELSVAVPCENQPLRGVGMRSYKARFTWQQGVTCAASPISRTNCVDRSRYLAIVNSLIEDTLGAVNQLAVTSAGSLGLRRGAGRLLGRRQMISAARKILCGPYKS